VVHSSFPVPDWHGPLFSGIILMPNKRFKTLPSYLERNQDILVKFLNDIFRDSMALVV